MTYRATNLIRLLPKTEEAGSGATETDESADDATRLLRIFGRRALFLAALALLAGLHMLALLLALAGVGLLVVPTAGPPD